MMQANCVTFRSPQFRLLSTQQLEDLHFASLHILERTGVTIISEEAIGLLADAGADVSNPKRVKIPCYVVEQALRTAPKNITLYTRNGRPSIFLNGTRTYFGGSPDNTDILDPYTHERRPCYPDDTASLARLIDYLPNISWAMTAGLTAELPGGLAERVVGVQTVLNTSKPVGCTLMTVPSLRAILEICSIVSGGMAELKARPFYFGSVSVQSPLFNPKDELEMSLITAELGIPNVIYPMPMMGATAPASRAGILAMVNAEVLSHLAVIQLKNPGAPVVYGGMPGIMDMTTTIYPYGSPELYLLTACLTELSHYYELPMFGCAGMTDAKVVGAQAAAETMYQCLMSAFSGANLVHDTGLADHCTLVSPELIVLVDEVIEMVKVTMGGVEVNRETLALDLIDKVGPGGSYIAEDHTLEHFREFWAPRIMDRTRLESGSDNEPVDHCEDRLGKLTRNILETHVPQPLPEDIVREIRRVEASWFKELGLKYEYPKKEPV